MTKSSFGFLKVPGSTPGNEGVRKTLRVPIVRFLGASVITIVRLLGGSGWVIASRSIASKNKHEKLPRFPTLVRPGTDYHSTPTSKEGAVKPSALTTGFREKSGNFHFFSFLDKRTQ